MELEDRTGQVTERVYSILVNEAPAPPPPPPVDDGCGCTATGGTERGAAWIALFGLVLMLRRRLCRELAKATRLHE